MVLIIIFAQVAELVDAHVSGACAERRAGSSPVLGTIFFYVGEVAELVDALLWGGSVNCDVGVRVSSSSHSIVGVEIHMRK